MRALLALLLASVAVVAGCIQPEIIPNDLDDTSPVPGALTPVRDRHTLPYDTSGAYSQTLVDGLHGILPAFSVFVDVPVPLGNGLPTQTVHMGLFLPKIEGCDYEMAHVDDLLLHGESSALPEECRVPVVADIGPYYGEPVLGDGPAVEPARRLGGFLIENLVPHGYAVAQVSVLGTGNSGGCMDLMGPVEQAGVQGAVDWLGTQAWSNGAVGLIGRSYDGSTPWEAAMTGSPYLKTVVPISGLYGQHDLMWRNGSAETRGPGVLWGLYYAFTYTGNENDPALQARQVVENAACPDTQTGAAQGVAAYATGDRVVPEVNAYWRERSFKSEVLANYEGSVYFIHGMQDWNVDPHMAFPFYNELEAKGLEMKGLFGQWQHMYPDRPAEHDSCGFCPSGTSVRWDWAQDLLEWFDHYLKGTGPKPELHVEMQDAAGAWRIEETWPPRDVAWTDLALGDGLKMSSATNRVTPASGFLGAGLPVEEPVVFTAAPVNGTLRLAGLGQFHVEVTPLGAGGQLFAELRDATDNKRLGHAVMDLRYANGGSEMTPVVPGQKLTARMEFFPMDVVVPEGHVLELVITSTGADYLPAAVNAPVHIEGGVLRLPAITRGADAFFTPPSA